VEDHTGVSTKPPLKEHAPLISDNCVGLGVVLLAKLVSLCEKWLKKLSDDDFFFFNSS